MYSPREPGGVLQRVLWLLLLLLRPCHWLAPFALSAWLEQDRFVGISLQEFDTACALAKGLLQRLLGASVSLVAKRIDDGGVEGEPCAGAPAYSICRFQNVAVLAVRCVLGAQAPVGAGFHSFYVFVEGCASLLMRIASRTSAAVSICAIYPHCHMPAVLYPEDKSFLTVVFPTADRLKQLQVRPATTASSLPAAVCSQACPCWKACSIQVPTLSADW
jgi:hypothetical protein